MDEQQMTYKTTRSQVTRQLLRFAVMQGQVEPLDVGIEGVNKASRLSTVITGLEPGAYGFDIPAVGDSRNDMDLLKSSFLRLCGCPSNYQPTVKEYVKTQGGIVSE